MLEIFEHLPYTETFSYFRNVEALSNNWLPSSKQIENAMQYAGQIMSLSYIAKNSVTGFSAFCTIYFQFEGLLYFTTLFFEKKHVHSQEFNFFLF